ncbi:RFX DNA-binding domain-containing protein [Umbelopsis sp. PMI_123]|nr:RFX DNA-binding domain-containing protein [Umbelopsis sp. PMI_123]
MPRPSSKSDPKVEQTVTTHFGEVDVRSGIDHITAMRHHEVQSETGTPQSTSEDHINATSGHQRALDKATKEFVLNWIHSNYVRDKDHSVARNEAYEHYIASCEGLNLRPINSALYGKLMRSVFPDMTTRRLGTRGSSKYHYGGIKRRVSSDQTNNQAQSVSDLSPMNTTVSGFSLFSEESPLTANQRSQHFPSDTESPFLPSLGSETLVPALPVLTTAVTGTSESPLTLPRFFPPTLYSQHGPVTDDETVQLASDFTRLYAKHCSTMLTHAQTDQWKKIRREMMDFWHGLDSKYSKLLRESNEMVEAIWRWDSALYDCLMANSIGEITVAIPPPKTRALRQFASQYEDWVTESIKNYSADLYQNKVDVARLFVCKLRHHVLLNHEAKLASQIIQNEEKMTELQHDWAAIDLAMVIDQTTWICECRADDIEKIVVKDIVNLLYDGKSLDDWASWLKKLTSNFMLKTMDAGRFVHHARQIILKWNHYGSAIQKDFSLRSAVSLGTFMILKMFVDDYLIALVEGHIAELNVRLARPTAPPLDLEDEMRPPGGSHRKTSGDYSETPDSKSSRTNDTKPPFNIVFHRFR